MLKFFRRIRRKLLDEGSLGKYLVYAIGEILLVVIGILIALQINNWNEDRKASKDDLAFLQNLQKELFLDINNFNARATSYSQINNSIQKSLKIMQEKEVISQEEYDLISESIMKVSVLAPVQKNSNRNDLFISQGRLEKIDTILNTAYLNYLVHIENTNNIIQKLGESLITVVNDFIMPNVDFNYANTDTTAGKIIMDYQKVRNNRDLKNALHESYSSRQVYLNHLGRRNEEAGQLLKIVEEILSRKLKD